jgi:hypothetical protein
MAHHATPATPAVGARFLPDDVSTSSGLRIVEAKYGDPPTSRWVDVTSVVQAHVKGKRLDLVPTKDLFGTDPAPNVEKMLALVIDLDGEEISGLYPEGKRLELGR